MNFTYGLVCFAALAGWLDFRGPRRLEAGEVVFGDFYFFNCPIFTLKQPKRTNSLYRIFCTCHH